MKTTADLALWCDAAFCRPLVEYCEVLEVSICLPNAFMSYVVQLNCIATLLNLCTIMTEVYKLLLNAVSVQHCSALVLAFNYCQILSI